MEKSSKYLPLNKFTLNETYSSFKLSYLLLTQELSIMKEKNTHLNQRVKELESTISSITQRTITKHEMKEMIKESISPITNILIGKEKETINTQEQTDDVIINQKKSKIKRIENEITNEEFDTFGCVYSLIELGDKKIASGGMDGNISISSYEESEKKWKRDIHKKKAHFGCVNSLCALTNNKLLSGGIDHLIKVWAISDKDIAVIKEIKEHSKAVYKLIPLSEKRFASCSYDSTVKIWKDNNTYECLSTLKHTGRVSSILQIRNREMLVSGGYESSLGVSFWDLHKYSQLQSIKGYCVYWSSHMVELANGNVALSSAYKPYPIVIIDSSTYQVKKEIQLKEYIIDCSSLCVLDEGSFVYAYNGTFIQISSEDYSVLFQTQEGGFAGYWGGIVPIKRGKFFAVQYGKCISVIKPCYD